MKIRCLGNRGSQLPEAVLSFPGVTTDARYDIEVGAEYVVYATCCWTDCSWHYLIVDDAGHDRPSWYPADLFEIVDGRFPPHWMMSYFGWGDWPRSVSLKAVIGYAEMMDPAHHDALQDRREEALRLFAVRRRETEAWHSE